LFVAVIHSKKRFIESYKGLYERLVCPPQGTGWDETGYTNINTVVILKSLTLHRLIFKLTQ